MNERADTDSVSRSGQPAPVLIAWLAELVDDARRDITPRFLEIRKRLHSGEFKWECSGFQEAMLEWTAAANRLELSSVRDRGLWANLTGGAERKLRHFNENVAAVIDASARVRDELPLFEAACLSQQAARKMLVELEFEHKSLVSELMPATGWLAEVAEAMGKTTAAHSANRTWASAALRLESLPRDVKRLHALAEGARLVSALGLKILADRIEALRCVRALLSDFDRTWLRRIPSLSRTSTQPLAAATASPLSAAECHDELLQRLDALCHILHDLETGASEMDARLWDLAELGA